MESNSIDENLRKQAIYPLPEDGSLPKQFITFTDDTIEISEKAENDFAIIRSYKHYLWEIMLILSKIDGTVGVIPVRPIMEDNIKEIFSDQRKLNILFNYPWKLEMLIEEIIWTIDDILENPLTLNIENYDPRKKDSYTIRDYLGEGPNKTWRDFGPDGDNQDFNSGPGGQQAF
jgi:hypothetical protein